MYSYSTAPALPFDSLSRLPGYDHWELRFRDADGSCLSLHFTPEELYHLLDEVQAACDILQGASPHA